MKTLTIIYYCSLVSICVLLGGCADKTPSTAQEENSSVQRYVYAASNSYLVAAMGELLGSDTKIYCMASPGMCPGHFDISPGLVKELRSAEILVRFDFQSSMDTQLKGLTDAGMRIESITPTGGLCVPDTYIDICTQLAEILSVPERKLTETKNRITAHGQKLKAMVAENNYTALPVITSNHQAAFAEYLGLDVVGTFKGGDMETISAVQDLISKGRRANVKIIIANKQQGLGLANAIAERINADTAVFSNFPELEVAGSAFEDMLEKNVTSLLDNEIDRNQLSK